MPPTTLDRLGAPPPAVAIPAPAAGTAATPAGPGSEGTPGPTTTQEKILAGASPADAGDAPALIYEVPFGKDKRKLTPEQIASTFERYQSLNADHAQLKPIIALARQLAEKSGKPVGEVANFLLEAAKNYGKTQTGAQPTPATAAAPEADDELLKWEQENAASLPPGYRDMNGRIASVAQGQEALMKKLDEILTASSGVADAAKTAQLDARQQRITATKQQIMNNLNLAQQKLGLPDDQAQDFMTFAAERGFTMEDFADPDLTQRVAQDFKANMGTPELERLKGIAARRQAYSGSLGATPAAGTPPAAAAGEPALDRLAATARAARA